MSFSLILVGFTDSKVTELMEEKMKQMSKKLSMFNQTDIGP